MSTAPGSVKLVKGGFVQLDAANAVSKIIGFQYNPETLVRRLEGVNAAVPPPVLLPRRWLRESLRPSRCSWTLLTSCRPVIP
jgi:hypothetical protein